MNGWDFSYVDRQQVLSPGELQTRIKAAEPVLVRAAAGEKNYADKLGWLDVNNCASLKQVDSWRKLALKIKPDLDAFVDIGIGGSNQAARAAVTALCPPDGDKIIWAGNTLSAFELERTLKLLDTKKSIYLNCIAKNFETLEPGITFRVLRHYLERRYGRAEAAKRIFATGTFGSSLDRFCQEEGFTFLEFPVPVGGRYSIGTAVGLFPMAVAGINISALTEGMRAMQKELRSCPAESNPALKYACWRNLCYEHGYRLEMLAFFEPRLRYLAKWWVQLYAESEGKEGKGLYPVASCNSEDLHATGQFVQQGTPVILETFLEIAERDASVLVPEDERIDHFAYVAGKDFWDINKIAMEATFTAHSERGIPCANLCLPALDAYNLGALFYFFMFSCYLDGEILGINPFNEPGVDAYKHYMFKNLGKRGY